MLEKCTYLDNWT